jgi:NAD(P)H-dependent flavin oxidoreductase YrpB (nitropropane dioxygenase family)
VSEVSAAESGSLGAAGRPHARAHPALHTRFCEMVGIEYPIVQTGMGYVAGANLTAATANAGGLGILGSSTMDFAQFRDAVKEIKDHTDRPFGVNFRSDQDDVDQRVDLFIEQGIKVASFALAPRGDLIARLKEAGVVCMPSIGAKRHAEKVLDFGVDALIIQGGEGGGHTGPVPTTVLLPQVIDTVKGRIPVIAAGGFFDGRGLVAALAYGADGIAMGTRFLMSSDSRVPEVTKQEYVKRGVTDTVWTTKVDGMPHRVLRNPLVDKLLKTTMVTSLPRAASNALAFKKLSGTKLTSMLKEGLAMKKGHELSYASMIMAANTPMLLKRAMVDGHPDDGVMSGGVVLGLLDDLPSCEDILQRIVTQANEILDGFAKAGAEGGA